MKIQLVLADIDGTMVQPASNYISSPVLQATKILQSKNIRLAAVTGRHFEMAKPFFESLGVTTPCVINGGSTIVEPQTGKVISERLLPVESAREAIAILMPVCTVAESSGIRMGASSSDTQIVEPTSHIWASVPAELADQVVQTINQIDSAVAHANPGPGGDFSRTGIQVTHIEGDKFHGVQNLLKLLRIESEAVMGIGDGDNDLPLLQASGLKIAMGNAPEMLRNAADHVVGTVDEDGFAEAVIKYL